MAAAMEISPSPPPWDRVVISFSPSQAPWERVVISFLPARPPSERVVIFQKAEQLAEGARGDFPASRCLI